MTEGEEGNHRHDQVQEPKIREIVCVAQVFRAGLLDGPLGRTEQRGGCKKDEKTPQFSTSFVPGIPEQLLKLANVEYTSETDGYSLSKHFRADVSL